MDQIDEKTERLFKSNKDLRNYIYGEDIKK